MSPISKEDINTSLLPWLYTLRNFTERFHKREDPASKLCSVVLAVLHPIIHFYIFHLNCILLKILVQNNNKSNDPWFHYNYLIVNVRENRRGFQEWAIHAETLSTLDTRHKAKTNTHKTRHRKLGTWTTRTLQKSERESRCSRSVSNPCKSTCVYVKYKDEEEIHKSSN